MTEFDSLEAREKILKFLNDNELTQVAVAQTVKVRPDKLSQYLTGEDTGPTAYRTLAKILTRYGIK